MRTNRENILAVDKRKMRRGKGDCGKDEFFFLEFFCLGLIENGEGARKLSNFFPDFFLGEGFLK